MAFISLRTRRKTASFLLEIEEIDLPLGTLKSLAARARSALIPHFVGVS